MHQSRHIIFYTFYMLWVYFTCFSCTAYFSGLREKNQPNILTHKIYLGISHSDSTHINSLSYILSAPRISFKKRHQRMTGGQNLLFILLLLSIIQLFLLQPPPKPGKVSANINSNTEIVHVSPREAPLPSPDPWDKPAAPAQSGGNPNRLRSSTALWEI